MKTRMSQKHCNTIKSNNCSTFVQNIKQSKIKKEILGVKDEQTRAICYELYQFYIESYMENSLDKDIIEVMKDSEKALYYGKLYLGD